MKKYILNIANFKKIKGILNKRNILFPKYSKYSLHFLVLKIKIEEFYSSISKMRLFYMVYLNCSLVRRSNPARWLVAAAIRIP